MEIKKTIKIEGILTKKKTSGYLDIIHDDNTQQNMIFHKNCKILEM